MKENIVEDITYIKRKPLFTYDFGPYIHMLHQFIYNNIYNETRNWLDDYDSLKLLITGEIRQEHGMQVYEHDLLVRSASLGLFYYCDLASSLTNDFLFIVFF